VSLSIVASGALALARVPNRPEDCNRGVIWIAAFSSRAVVNGESNGWLRADSCAGIGIKVHPAAIMATGKANRFFVHPVHNRMETPLMRTAQIYFQVSTCSLSVITIIQLEPDIRIIRKPALGTTS
jgi:hypothetical protein